MNSPRHGQRNKPSTWTRSRRELASSQGITLTIALVSCFFFTVVAVILEGVLNVSRDIVYPILVVVYVLVIAMAMVRISRVNKQAAEVRKEAYLKKFGREES
ncbi:hypothetical protein ACFL6S_15550 [Candidatus Poribacteria bacterium]